MTVAADYAPLHNSHDLFRYDGPDFDQDGIVVKRFEVESGSIENLRLAMDGRGCPPGIYASLMVDGRLWMSDTNAEYRDHIGPIAEVGRHPGGRGLINGLGLGCILNVWATVLDHVDVVEIDQRVIDTLGAHYLAKFPGKITIHRDDAYTIGWPTGTRWDVAWHDIWLDLCEDNLPEMATLHRRYGRRSLWQGSWGRALLERERSRRRNRGSWW